MADLFGKPDKKPYVAPSPFYCYQCAGTTSKKCKDCGTRICRRHGDRCERCAVATMIINDKARAATKAAKLSDRIFARVRKKAAQAEGEA